MLNIHIQAKDITIQKNFFKYPPKEINGIIGYRTTSSRIKSHDLIYEEGDYMYYDTYLGTKKFAGEEAIWIKDIPYWSMNYIGRVIGANFSGDFLQN